MTKARMPKPPPLENGDQVDRGKFERRWEAMPHLQKAELIEGSVYLSTAVSHVVHGAPCFDLICALGMYHLATPGLRLNLTAALADDWAAVFQTVHAGNASAEHAAFVELLKLRAAG